MLRFTVVASLALLLDVFVSPDVETVATLVTLGTAPAATLTVSVMLLLVPGVSGPALLQVTVCAAAEQLQPVPAADTNPKPVGSVSMTVIVAVVEPEPIFRTVIV